MERVKSYSQRKYFSSDSGEDTGEKLQCAEKMFTTPFYFKTVSFRTNKQES